MPAKDLLSINPDVLFEEHTISEIDDTQKKLLHEIERKREELRVMVGERYRDLIEAADTIGDMKSTAQNCIKHIENMTLTCRNLHDTHLIGFKNEFIPTNIDKPVISRQVHGIAIQIKILMAIPEQIWSNIDVEDFLTATQLYLFARHIYTGLLLETGGQSSNKSISALMPVVHRQWNSLSNFNSFLMDACQNKLGNADLKAEVAASCLASMLLLDSKKNLLDLMNTFITLHSTNSLSNILTSDLETNLSQGNVKNDIKDRIATSVKVIVRTVELLYSCFVENGGGLILSNLQSLFKKNSPPLINLVKFHDTLGLKLLPPVVADFRLSPPFELKPVSSSELSNRVNSWMTWVKQFTGKRVESLLKYVKSAKSLHTIREDATKLETPQNWHIICRTLTIDQQNTNIWVSHFQPLLTNRLKDIISVKWADISRSLVESINHLLENVSQPGCRETEANLNWFVWSDLIGQSSIDSRDDIIKSINTLMKGMTMQDRGFTPNLEKLCESFNLSLGTMLGDLDAYLYGTLDKTPGPEGQSSSGQFDSDVKKFLLEKLDGKDSEQESKHSDCVEVENYLRKCSMDNINSFLEYVHRDCISKKESDAARKTASILTARFLLATPQLVPNLRFCFVPAQKHNSNIFEDVSTVDSDASKSWEEVCKLLSTNCQLCWEKWIEISMKRVDELLLEMPQEFTVLANMDYLLVQWDSITIEEKDDQDNPISSTIKIPAGPSIKLQQFLYSTSRLLDEVIPHTLPKKTHNLFIVSVAERVLQYFLKVIKDKSEEINQKCALQLLMDVRHLTLLLVTRENKKALMDSHEVCDLLKQKIDPFDYDVFYPRLQTNAKRSVQRVQTLLGSLIPNHDQLNSIIGPKALVSGGTTDKEPNAYILTGQGNTVIAWFPLLPVTAPLSARKQAEKQRKKQTAGTLVQSKSAASLSDVLGASPSSAYHATNASNIVRSGAAAFFGSMTSDWFGSN